jgi:hypothetical protein
MKKLDSFDFKSRPTRSRYKEAYEALVEEECGAVVLERGEDFPENATLQNVQGGVSEHFRKRGKKVTTRTIAPDQVVVGLEGDATPRRQRKGPRRRALASA